MKLLKAFRYLDVRNIYKDVVGDKSPSKVIGKAKPFLKDTLAMIDSEIKTAREKLKDIPGTNYELGLYHLRNGNLSDAVMRFKMVIYLIPEKAEAYYNLGRAQLKQGDSAAALGSLQKALSLKPDFHDASYVIEKIKSPESIDAVPKNFIDEHLEWRNEAEEELSEFSEQANKLLVSAVLSNIFDKNPNLEVLDLGSKLGIRGRFLKNKEVAKRIVGVDIDAKANTASARELFEGEVVYNSIVNSEIGRDLSEVNDKFDAVLAGDVFSYHGKLERIFSDVARLLKPSGIFALITKENALDKHYKLDIANDKFTHSMKYIEETLKNSGFIIVEKKTKEVEFVNFNIIIAKNAAS